MIESNVEFEDKSLALILPIINNNCKVGFCLLLSILLYIYLLCIWFLLIFVFAIARGKSFF